MQYFSALVKPASSLCNLRCAYCFYHDVAKNRETSSFGVMKEETVRSLLSRIAAFVRPPARVSFLFQGGEPTLAGLPFFQKFVQLSEEMLKGIEVNYSIQTNGLLLDNDWCGFLAKNQVLTGISWDGPADIHDLHRTDAGGKGTFTAVRRAVERLERHGAQYNVLCVVTRAAARHPDQLMRFFLGQKVRHLQFIPCLEPLEEDGGNAYALTPRMYGAFLIRMFTLWQNEQKKGRELHIRTFENLFLLLQGRPAEQCGAMGFCTPQFVVEADGGVYPCDFYVLDEYRCGSVETHSIEEIRDSEALRSFMDTKEPKPALCAACPVYRLCGGGCKRYRRFYAQEADYCPYQAFLTYALRELQRERRCD